MRSELSAIALMALVVSACGDDAGPPNNADGGAGGFGGAGGTGFAGAGGAPLPTRADCNHSMRDGLEAHLEVDPLNCGVCGKECGASAHAYALCEHRSCTFLCKPGFADCDLDSTNDCETDLLADEGSCGACFATCAALQGVANCNAGTCALACSAEFRDCNLDGTDGCETRTADNTEHCGACGHACNATNGTPGCRENLCSIACDVGYGDCNFDVRDGCESSTPCR